MDFPICYPFTFRSVMANVMCEIDAININHHHPMLVSPRVAKNTKNVTHTFMQYKQPPNGLAINLNGFGFNDLNHSNPRPQNPKICSG